KIMEKPKETNEVYMELKLISYTSGLHHGEDVKITITPFYLKQHQIDYATFRKILIKFAEDNKIRIIPEQTVQPMEFTLSHSQIDSETDRFLNELEIPGLKT
ncbi:MAG: hypothetical protein ACFFCQ_08530, partial [Promethearchaeota archaeon]